MDEIERAVSALHALDPGCSREQWVRIGMAAKDAGVSLNDFTAWSSTAGNYDGERDCQQVWKSFSDGPVKAGTLYSMSFAAGWEDPAKHRHNGHGRRQAVTAAANPIRPQQTPPRADKSISVQWERCIPATGEHPYILAKRGQPDGLRIVGAGDTATIAGQSIAGWLVVPALSLNGDLRTLQLIPPPDIAARLKAAGKQTKLNMPGASFGDGMFIVGNIAESSRVFIVEGIGQAWACWQATGCAAVVCFGAGRLSTVTDLLRTRHPELRLIVVPDRGKEIQAAEIARAVLCEWVELPGDKPANYDVNDFAAEYGADELAVLLDKVKLPAMRYKLLGAGDLMNTPPLRWLVRSVIPANGLACIYGASASGKSFLALDMCAAVADGLAWFDCRVTAAPVVYVALEGEHGFRQRVKAWQAHHGRDLPPALRFVMQPFDMRKAGDVGELADAVIASGGAGGLLVIDTLNRAAGGADENSSADMGQLIDAAKALQSQLGGTVLLVHHSGKDASKGLRGHSSLHAALDAAIEVTRNDDRREWRIAKSKDDGDSAAYPFRLVVVEIGSDEHGDTITSCAVEADDRSDSIKRIKLPQGPTQKTTHDALGDLLRESKHFGKSGAPGGRPCVELDAAVLATADLLTCRADQRQYQARRAITAMVGKGMYQVREGWLWDSQ